MGNQTMRQAARLAASQAYAKCRRTGPSVTGAWRSLPSRCWTALGETDATIAATEQRAGAARDDHRRILDGVEAVQWCAGAISHREATRLRHLTAGPLQPGVTFRLGV